MSNKEIIKQNVGFILGLAAIALLRPILKITGFIHFIGNEQFGSILMTVLISLVWLFAIVKKNSQHPVRMMIFTGITYAIFAIILSGILSPILDGELRGPLTNPLAIISVLVTNSVWGLLIGGLALAIRKK